jgi:hypothetical protein
MFLGIFKNPLYYTLCVKLVKIDKIPLPHFFLHFRSLTMGFVNLNILWKVIIVDFVMKFDTTLQHIQSILEKCLRIEHSEFIKLLLPHQILLTIQLKIIIIVCFCGLCSIRNIFLEELHILYKLLRCHDSNCYNNHQCRKCAKVFFACFW